MKKIIRRFKNILRPLILYAINRVLVKPKLRRLIKPVVQRFPFVYKRLYALVRSTQLSGVHGAQLTLSDGNICAHAGIYLDKTSRQVLVDLKKARQREQ